MLETAAETTVVGLLSALVALIAAFYRRYVKKAEKKEAAATEEAERVAAEDATLAKAIQGGTSEDVETVRVILDARARRRVREDRKAG